MSLLDLPDETELKRLVGTKPYWDQRHPDHRRVYETVTNGYRRLYGNNDEGTIHHPLPPMPTDEAFRSNLERGRQWLRNGGYQLMAQAQQGDGEKPKEAPPPFDIPVKRPMPDVGPNGPFEEAAGWIMKIRKEYLKQLGLPDNKFPQLPPDTTNRRG
ncbi:MAG: hypothetical protein WC722_02365 [Rhodospirillales bacterium]|jgi:hypothetical protein